MHDKTKIVCPVCHTGHTAGRWNAHTVLTMRKLGYKNAQLHRIQDNLGNPDYSYICPGCKSTVNASDFIENEVIL